MPKMQECLITIDPANALRATVTAMGLKVPEGDMGFRCPRCHKPVKPHDASESQAVHFEHLARNYDCPLSTGESRFQTNPNLCVQPGYRRSLLLFICDEYVWECDHLIDERLTAPKVPALDGSKLQAFAYDGKSRVLEIEFRVTVS